MKKQILFMVLVAIIMIILGISYSISSVVELASLSKMNAKNQLTETTGNIVDPDTSNNYSDLENGEVWTDKSVYDNQNGSMDVQLSAIAQKNLIKQENEQGYDVVFVLDKTGSMVQQDNGKIRAETMINSVNSAIQKLMESSSKNRIAVTTFSTDSATLMPLDRYTTVNNKYVDFITADEMGDGWPGIKVNDDVRSTTGKNIDYGAKVVRYGTYTQLGISEGSKILINTDSTENIPILILVTDGYPTVFTTAYTSPSTSNIARVIKSDGLVSASYSSAIQGYNTILTANYCKKAITDKYQKQAKVYTIGMIPDKVYSNAILNPTQENIEALKNDDGVSQKMYEYLHSTEQFQDTDLIITNRFNDGYLDGQWNGTYDADTKTITYKKDKVNPIEVDEEGTYLYADCFSFITRRDTNYQYAYLTYTVTIEGHTADGQQITETIPQNIQGGNNTYIQKVTSMYGDLVYNGETIDAAETYIRYKGNVELYDVTVTVKFIDDTTEAPVYYTGFKNPYMGSENYADKAFIGSLSQEELDDAFEEIINETQKQEDTLKPNTNLTFEDTIGANFSIPDSLTVKYNGTDYVFEKNGTEYICSNPGNLTNLRIIVEDKTIKVSIPSEIVPIYGEGIQPIKIRYTLNFIGKSDGRYYTNDSAKATYTPYESNAYYKNFEGNTISKTSNNTGTSENVKESKPTNDGNIEDTLGNNGRIVVENINITVRKVWDDADNIINRRPDSVVLKLIGTSTDGVDYTYEATVTKDDVKEDNSNTWEYIFAGVPKYDFKGNEITYTVEEENVDSYYTKAINQENLTVTNKAQYGNVLVHYYIQGTEEAVPLQDGTKANDVTIEGKIGEKYSTNAASNVDSRYELVETPSKAEGNFINGQIVVTYYYRLKATSVLVHHYKENTTEQLSKDVTINGEVGDDYTTQVATDIPQNYELVETPAYASGKMTEDQIVVTYYYRLKTPDITNQNITKTGTDRITVAN